MSGFIGGSAWAMARDIGKGNILLTARTIARLNRAEMDQLYFELERFLRQLRGEQPDLADTLAIRSRNQTLVRLRRAQSLVQAHRTGRRPVPRPGSTGS
jgi:hypothetical protein